MKLNWALIAVLLLTFLLGFSLSVHAQSNDQATLLKEKQSQLLDVKNAASKIELLIRASEQYQRKGGVSVSTTAYISQLGDLKVLMSTLQYEIAILSASA